MVNSVVKPLVQVGYNPGRFREWTRMSNKNKSLSVSACAFGLEKRVWLAIQFHSRELESPACCDQRLVTMGSSWTK